MSEWRQLMAHPVGFWCLALDGEDSSSIGSDHAIRPSINIVRPFCVVARPPGDFVFVERETKVSGAREPLVIRCRVQGRVVPWGKVR